MSKKPGDRSIQAWVSPGLHKATKKKLADTGWTLREIVVYFLEKWTGYKEETNAATGKPDNPETE
jgi:hypothetical protein